MTQDQECVRYNCYSGFIYELVGSQVPWAFRLDLHGSLKEGPRDLALLPLHHSSENLADISSHREKLLFRLDKNPS